MKTITLIVKVDTREQQPLKFPTHSTFWGGDSLYSPGQPLRIKTSPERLDTGDYAIGGFEEIVRVERKKNSREVFKNTSTLDRSRFLDALHRLGDCCRHPLLLIEQPPWAWFHTSRHVSADDARKSLDRLLTESARHGIMVMFGAAKSSTVAQRRRLGEVVLHWMLAQIIAEKGKLIG